METERVQQAAVAKNAQPPPAVALKAPQAPSLPALPWRWASPPAEEKPAAGPAASSPPAPAPAVARPAEALSSGASGASGLPSTSSPASAPTVRMALPPKPAAKPAAAPVDEEELVAEERAYGELALGLGARSTGPHTLFSLC